VNTKTLATIALAAGLTVISATPSSALVTSIEFVPSTTCPGTDTTLFINGQSTNLVSIGAGYWYKQTLDGVVTYLDGASSDLWPGLYPYADFSTWPATYEWIMEIYQGDPRVPGSTLVVSEALSITGTCPTELEDESDDSEPLAATGSNPAVGTWIPALGLGVLALGTLRFWRRQQSR
jgi:hypothetical protein